MNRDASHVRVDGFAGYDVVRVLLGLLLLTAAGLKGYQLATEPVAGTGLLDSRWFLIGVVEFELLFGLSLLAGVFPKQGWCVALACFACFASVSLAKALSGESSCGGFGQVTVNPWYTFGLDALLVCTLFFKGVNTHGCALDFGSPRTYAVASTLCLGPSSSWSDSSQSNVTSKEGVGPLRFWMTVDETTGTLGNP